MSSSVRSYVISTQRCKIERYSDTIGTFHSVTLHFLLLHIKLNHHSWHTFYTFYCASICTNHCPSSREWFTTRDKKKQRQLIVLQVTVDSCTISLSAYPSLVNWIIIINISSVSNIDLFVNSRHSSGQSVRFIFTSLSPRVTHLTVACEIVSVKVKAPSHYHWWKAGKQTFRRDNN